MSFAKLTPRVVVVTLQHCLAKDQLTLSKYFSNCSFNHQLVKAILHAINNHQIT